MAAEVLVLGLATGCLVAARAGRYRRPGRVAVAGVTALMIGVLALPQSRSWAAAFFAVALGLACYRETTRRRARHASPTHDATTAAATPS